MAKPLVTTMPVDKIGRETDQNIRRIAINVGDVDARVQTLTEQVQGMTTGLSQAQVQALINTSLAAAGVTTHLRSGDVSGTPSPAPTPGPAVDHTDVVVAAKAAVVAAIPPISISGDCGAFEITSRVAWHLNTAGGGTEDAGLLDKPSGANCLGFAAGIICYPTGQIYDILGDAGGANNPQWIDSGIVDPTRYRAPTDPGPPYF